MGGGGEGAPVRGIIRNISVREEMEKWGEVFTE